MRVALASCYEHIRLQRTIAHVKEGPSNIAAAVEAQPPCLLHIAEGIQNELAKNGRIKTPAAAATWLGKRHVRIALADIRDAERDATGLEPRPDKIAAIYEGVLWGLAIARSLPRWFGGVVGVC